MELDRERLRAIVDEPHAFYAPVSFEARRDYRLRPGTKDFLAAQFEPWMDVLDLGCGSGELLVQNHTRLGHGVGIDNDPAHIELAERARDCAGADNLEFLLCDLAEVPSRFGADRFDLVLSERGPLTPSSISVQRALHALKPGGLIFGEMIGEQHHREVAEAFGLTRRGLTTRVIDQARVAFERNGVEIRIAADSVTKWCYPDVYEWLRFQCDIWAWAGHPLPDIDDPEQLAAIRRLVERHTNASGELETTHHSVWVGGTKGEPPGWEPELI